MARTIAIIAGVIILVAGHGPAAVSDAAEAGHHGATTFEHVHALTFDAAARSLWLGAHAGLFRSEDGGHTWTKVALPLQNKGIARSTRSGALQHAPRFR